MNQFFMPKHVIECRMMAKQLAHTLGVPYAANASSSDGLYIALRSRRLEGIGNRKYKFYTVRLFHCGTEVFRSEEQIKDFPTDHLITQLMLVAK